MKQTSYMWVIVTTLLFPVIENFIYLLRFSHLPNNIWVDSLIFLPTGLISGVILVYFLRKATSERQKKRVTFGYVFAVPFALLFLLFGALILPLLVTTAVIAVIPLVAGTLIGFSTGK